MAMVPESKEHVPGDCHCSGKLLIGRQEYLDFPEWDLHHLRVKIDTGACSSALDVAAYELKEGPDGQLIAYLRLALNRRHPGRLTEVKTPVVKMVMVRSSIGMRESRPLIETLMRLGPIDKRIRLTITNRASMRFRMILGREALAGNFIVDVSQRYLLRH